MFIHEYSAQGNILERRSQSKDRCRERSGQWVKTNDKVNIVRRHQNQFIPFCNKKKREKKRRRKGKGGKTDIKKGERGAKKKPFKSSLSALVCRHHYQRRASLWPDQKPGIPRPPPPPPPPPPGSATEAAPHRLTWEGVLTRCIIKQP